MLSSSHTVAEIGPTQACQFPQRIFLHKAAGRSVRSMSATIDQVTCWALGFHRRHVFCAPHVNKVLATGFHGIFRRNTDS